MTLVPLSLAILPMLCLADGAEPRVVKAVLPRVAVAPSMARDTDLSTWRGAFTTSAFGMVEPDDKGVNRWPTVIHALWGPDALYVAVEAKDPEPSQVRASRQKRDVFNDTDVVGIDLDPTGQGQTGIRFFITPLGGQMDARVSDMTGEDPSYDCLWDAVGFPTPEGYLVKFRIPYSSLRRSPGEWGFRVFRVIPRERRYAISWPPMSRDVSCELCQVAKVSGAPVDKAATPFMIIPTVTAKRDEEIDGETLALGAPQTTRRLGFDLRYAGPSLTLDGTYKPDFSNVEADVDPLQINSRYKVLYAEKRPFFLEGMDLLNVVGAQRQFFSRALLDPQYGLKASGQSARTSWSLLHARDQAGGTAMTSEGAVGTDGRATRDSVGAVRLQLDQRGSGLSLVGTDRQLLQGEGGGTSGGVYLNQFLGKGFQFTGSAMTAVTHLPKGGEEIQSLRGSATHANLSWNNRTWSAFANMSATGRDLVLLSGFTDLKGYRSQGAGGRWIGRWNEGRWSQASVFVRTYQLADWDGNLLERSTGVTGALETAGRWVFSLRWDPVGASRALGRQVDMHLVSTQIGWNRHTTFRPTVAAETRKTQNLRTGEPSHYRAVALAADGAVGPLTYGGALRENTLDRDRDGSRTVRARSVDISAGMMFPGNIYAQFQGFVVRYTYPTLENVDRYSRVVVGWQPNAFTHAYLGWAGRTMKVPEWGVDPERIVNRGIFAKFAYAVQF